MSKLEKMISICRWFIMTLVKTLYISSFSAPSIITFTKTTNAMRKTTRVAVVKKVSYLDEHALHFVRPCLLNPGRHPEHSAP
jgi:hypothetical protein